MSLKDILQKIADANVPILLSDGDNDWEASALLSSLSMPMLRRPAYMQSGLYIAEVNDGGYLGRVMYKIKRK